jgi:uncharacterized membrane protein YkvA (DUF1232 family)
MDDSTVKNMSEAEGREKIKDAQDKEKSILEKAKKLDKAKFRKLFNQIMLFIELLRDYKSKKYVKIPWTSLAVAAFALLYFLNPFDIIPDYIPGIGYLDDAVVVAGLLKSIQVDLLKYCKFKGYDEDKYF